MLVEQLARVGLGQRPTGTAAAEPRDLSDAVLVVARHLRDVGRAYTAAQFPRVMMTIDNAPLHRDEPVRAALRDHPNLWLCRLPSHSPQRNVIEQLWKLLRRRATHNRLLEAPPAMCAALRESFRHYQVMQGRILSMIRSPRRRSRSHAP